MLTYNQERDRWELEIYGMGFWMTAATFSRYVDAYFEEMCRRDPTYTQERAVQHCRRYDYWAYARYDPEIHFGKE